MDFASFVEGPLLWFVFVCLLLATAARLAFFVFAVIKSNKGKKKRYLFSLSITLRALLPYHKGILQKPVYTTLRYMFHICLFVVPLGLSGHIVLLEESRFGWSWGSLPYHLADGMTLALLAIASYFLIRRIAVSALRKESSLSDYLLITAAILPFLTGYFLAHGTLEGLPFLADQMRTLHVLAGEAVLITAMFLFYRTTLILGKCTGCGSCVIACPTKTLVSKDGEGVRRFSYLHYQCICCGACVKVCPEDAAALRHEINLKRLSQYIGEEIRSVALLACNQCGTLYAPEPQLKRMHQGIQSDFITLCPQCRMLNYGETLRKTMGAFKKRTPR